MNRTLVAVAVAFVTLNASACSNSDASGGTKPPAQTNPPAPPTSQAAPPKLDACKLFKPIATKFHMSAVQDNTADIGDASNCKGMLGKTGVGAGVMNEGLAQWQTNDGGQGGPVTLAGHKGLALSGEGACDFGFQIARNQTVSFTYVEGGSTADCTKAKKMAQEFAKQLPPSQ